MVDNVIPLSENPEYYNRPRVLSDGATEKQVGAALAKYRAFG